MLLGSNFSMPCATEEPVHFALLIDKALLSIAGAAEIAVQTVNANEDLLPGRRMEYSWANSGCNASKGLQAMGDLLRGTNQINAVIGPACSQACEVMKLRATFCFFVPL